MKICKYDFSENGINELYNDCLEMVWDALEDKHPDFNISDLDINISIGDKKLIIPLHADSFEMLFEFLEKLNGGNE